MSSLIDQYRIEDETLYILSLITFDDHALFLSFFHCFVCALKIDEVLIDV
jgi:hypothetical protein